MVDPEISRSDEVKGANVHVRVSTSSLIVAVNGVPLSEINVANVREFVVKLAPAESFSE